MKFQYLIVLLFSVLTAAASPWNYSTFWSEDSLPALPGTQVKRMTAHDGECMIAGNGGIALYRFENGKYNRYAFRAFNGLLDAVRLGREIVLLDRDGLGVWNPALNRVRRSGKLKNLSQSYNFPMLAPASKAGKVLVIAQNALYEFDPDTLALVYVKIGVRGGKAAVTGLPDGSAAIYNMDRLYRYDGTFREMPLPAGFKQFEAFHLGCSSDGRYLYFGSPLAAYELATGRIVRTVPELRLIRWGFATDTRRNELYAAGWRDVNVFSNADDPAKWKEINRLGSTDAVPLYTHRDVAPAACAGALCYLPESDELLFSGRPGVTILGSKPHSGGLAAECRRDKFIVNNSSIPGNSALHRALRERKFIGAWVTTSHGVTDEALDNMKRSGINAVIHMVFQIDHGRFYPPHDVRRTVIETGKRCAERGMTYLIALTPYNISINNSKRTFRKFILPDGTTGHHSGQPRNPKFTIRDFPCYLDREYSEQAGIRHNMEEFARLAAEANIAGIVFELGDGISPTNIRSHHHCYCDYCFYGFFRDNGMDAVETPPQKRAEYIRAAGKTAAYAGWQTAELAKLCSEGYAAMRNIAPDMSAAVMLPETASDYTGEWLYTAFISGFQHSGTPVPVFSEQTYAVPYMPELCNKLDEKWKEKGLETLLIPGQVNYWVPPAVLARRVKNYLDHTPGVYYYHNYQWYTGRRGEKFYKPLNPKFQTDSYTLGEYMDLPNPLSITGSR